MVLFEKGPGIIVLQNICSLWNA